jgi:hypothetical protein
MKPELLINKTDLIFHEQNALVKDHGEYLSIETPNNPGYFWGNYLIFNSGPKIGEITRWRRIFRDRFSHNPLVRHETYTWENDEGSDIQQFIEQGFRPELHVTLSAENVVRPKKWNHEIQIRKLAGDADWSEALESHVQIFKSDYGESEYRKYRQTKNQKYREMIAQGNGEWFGAYLNGKLVGDLGLFWKENLGRFQLINTHPDFQRRGICGTLLYTASRYGFDLKNLKTLVIAADETYFAKEIYQSIGYKITERSAGVQLRPGCEVHA